MSRGLDLCTAHNRNLIKSCKSNIYRPEHESPNINNIFCLFIFTRHSLDNSNSWTRSSYYRQAHLKLKAASMALFNFHILCSFRRRGSSPIPNRGRGSIELHIGSLQASSALTVVHKRRETRGNANTPIRNDNHWTRRWSTNSLRKIIPKYTTLSAAFPPGLETTVVGLEFRVRQRHFRKGDMKLKVWIIDV